MKHIADFGVGTFHIMKVDRCRIHLIGPLHHLVLEDPLLAGLLPSQASALKARDIFKTFLTNWESTFAMFIF